MWLLDANMDVHLVAVLAELGFPAETAAQRGWKDLSNSRLVRAAVDAGFRCLLTRDRLFGESAAKALRQYPEFAVVVVGIPQAPWGSYRGSFLANWRAKPIIPKAGALLYWP